jgi:hypothetical protein
MLTRHCLCPEHRLPEENFNYDITDVDCGHGFETTPKLHAFVTTMYQISAFKWAPLGSAFSSMNCSNSFLRSAERATSPNA